MYDTIQKYFVLRDVPYAAKDLKNTVILRNIISI